MISPENPASIVIVSLLPRLPIITWPVPVRKFAIAVAPIPGFTVKTLKEMVGVLV